MIPVIYSRATGEVRRILAHDPSRGEPSKTAQEWGPVLAPILANAGLAVHFVRDGDPHDVLSAQVAVSQATGKIPADTRYVVVEAGVVVGWIGRADPACGDFDRILRQHPNAEFIKHAEADERWTFEPISKKFVAPPLTAEEASNVARWAARLAQASSGI